MWNELSNYAFTTEELKSTYFESDAKCSYTIDLKDDVFYSENIFFDVMFEWRITNFSVIHSILKLPYKVR